MGLDTSKFSPAERPDLNPNRASVIPGGAAAGLKKDNTVSSHNDGAQSGNRAGLTHSTPNDPVSTFIHRLDNNNKKLSLLERKLNHLFKPESIIDKLQVKTELMRIGTEDGVRKALSLDANEYVTIKLLIVPTGAGNAAQRLLASTFSNYGLVHIGLQINDKIVDWCNAGIVFIRPPQSSSAAALLDVRLKPGAFRNQHKATPELKAAICKTVVKWNVEKKYSSVNANCQTFVDELLAEANIKPFWPACISNYLIEMKKDPSNSKPHVIEPDGTKVVFESHEQVDDYVIKLRGYPSLYEELMPLLKAFDRAFWLQELKADKEPRESCPFQGITMLHGMPYGKDSPGDQRLRADIDPAIFQEPEVQQGSRVLPGSGTPTQPKQIVVPEQYKNGELTITVNELQERLETPMDESALGHSTDGSTQAAAPQSAVDGGRFSVGTPADSSRLGPSAIAITTSSTAAVPAQPQAD